MLYAQTDVALKLAELDNPYFANLYLKEKLVGTVCFLKRNVLNNDLNQEFFYVRYFTFLDKFRSAGTAGRKGKSSAIREEIHRLYQWVANRLTVSVDAMAIGVSRFSPGSR